MRKFTRHYPYLHACKHWLLIISLLIGIPGLAQRPSGKSLDTLVREISSDDDPVNPFTDPAFGQCLLRFGDSLLFVNKGICKGNFSAPFLFRHVKYDKPVNNVVSVADAHPPFLRIHGNVQYDFLYRSFIDTPFLQNDFRQHTIQTSLQVMVKDKYPLRVNLSNRISNSPYFRNFMDVNMRFDRNSFITNSRKILLDRIASQYAKRPDLTAAEAALKQAAEKYAQLKNELDDHDIWPRIIQARERLYRKEQEAARKKAEGAGGQSFSVPELNAKSIYKMVGKKMDTADYDISIDSAYLKRIEHKKQQLDSLQQQVQALQGKTDSIKNRISKSIDSVRRKIYKATNPGELTHIEQESGLAKDKKKGFEKFLSNVKSVGIGRSMINYSELTAWNVALTGISLEYNDGIYAAVAAGKIDYGFRDFMGKNTRRNGQNFLMGRIGWGDVDRKAVILSAFSGKKYNYGSVVNDTVGNHINLVGYSIEGILKKDENTGIGVELAKTTWPVSGSLNENKGLRSLFQFSDNANVGVSIKGQTLLHKTDTRLSGFYRRTGAYFQSFSLFTVNTSQTAWLFSVDQPLFNNKVGVVASLRRNDFTNPFAEKTFKSSTIFKSIQVNVRIPRWPVVSVGYYPGTQLYLIDKERIRENAYYIMNASVVHNYTAGGIRMLSSLLYNKYSSKGTDSGFIAYKGTSYMASHAFIFQRLQLLGMYMYTDQEQMQYYTLDGSADYSLSRSIKVGAGVKYNKIAGGNTCIGNRASLSIEVKKLGGLQMQYEKSYLPTIWQTLYPVETGRVTWFKYF